MTVHCSILTTPRLAFTGQIGAFSGQTFTRLEASVGAFLGKGAKS
jgi:hypothetical protein